MSNGYKPPVNLIRFAVVHAAGFHSLCGLSDNEHVTPEIVVPMLEAAAKHLGDTAAGFGASCADTDVPRLENGSVFMSELYTSAYRNFCKDGWTGVAFTEKYGGLNLPHVLSFAVMEMAQSVSLAFGLCPMLTQCAAAVLETHADVEQKDTYLPNLISGKWTGAMCFTETDAGSDLSSLKTTARPDGGGAYLINGQKIFISFGDHDMTENIIHIVPARLPDAPAGGKGISLFIVSKYAVNPDGSSGEKNRIECLSLENKTGLKASPTCLIKYNDAVGYLIGRQHCGMDMMFTMMNYARLLVGVQSVGIMERAFQAALSYAEKRVQGRSTATAGAGKTQIVNHPDVCRMLLTMQCVTEAARCLTYYAAAGIDLQQSGEEKIAQKARFRVDLLTPAVKAWCSDMASEITSTAMQIFGGAGYIVETEIEELWRDARILSIYEGTNGIQAAELIFRKILKDKGRAVQSFIKEMTIFCEDHLEDTAPATVSFITQFQEGLKRLEDTTQWILEKGANDSAAVACGATPYLQMFSIISAAYVYMKAALHLHAQNDKNEMDSDCIFDRVRFFGETFLPQAIAMSPTIKQSYSTILRTSFDKEKNK